MKQRILRRLQKIINRSLRPQYSEGYWNQRMDILSVPGDRFNHFSQYVTGKKVLHVGCTDHPVFRPENNLHISLAGVTSSLHGLDVDQPGIEELRKHVDQPYFSSFDQTAERYDVCLVPETIEHVDDVASFLRNMASVDSDVFLVTAPNAFCTPHMNRCHHDDQGRWIEGVHSDHNAWYSPYTLMNVIRKYSGLEVFETALIQYDTMICCACRKKKS